MTTYTEEKIDRGYEIMETTMKVASIMVILSAVVFSLVMAYHLF